MTTDELTSAAREMHEELAALRDLADRVGPAHETAVMVAQRAEHIAEAAARIAGGEYRPAYNGWPNRETWNAALWIGNEESWYRESRRIVADALADYEEPALLAEIRRDEPPEERAAGRRRGALRDAADALAEWYAEEIDAPSQGPLADIVGYALASVDWFHIAEGIADELPPAEDDPEADTIDDTGESWRP